MRQPLDLTGQRINALTVIRMSAVIKHNKRYWECICDCGSATIIRASILKSGKQKTCGCHRHGLSGTRLHSIWDGMKKRCYNTKHVGYPIYGGRGIGICDDWRVFLPFYEWSMSTGYADALTIDRIDNDKGYDPSNCRWVTTLEQARNRTPRGSRRSK